MHIKLSEFRNSTTLIVFVAKILIFKLNRVVTKNFKKSQETVWDCHNFKNKCNVRHQLTSRWQTAPQLTDYGRPM